MKARWSPAWAAFFALAVSACGNDPGGDPPDSPAGITPVKTTVAPPAWFDGQHGGMHATGQRPRVLYPVARGVSEPLAAILKHAPRARAKTGQPVPLHAGPGYGHAVTRKDAHDPIRQKMQPRNAPSPTISFDGTPNVDGVMPPDTNGDVGPNHYVEWVNLSIAVYDKTGTLLAGPSPGNTPWSGMQGSDCAIDNNGDPIVIYDSLADRWVFSQFALGTDGHQCIAVSQTPDPLGPYYTYDYLITTNGINDYPKLALWPDGYYLTVREFSNSGAFTNAAIAFDREAMVQGLPAAGVRFDVQDGNPGMDTVLAGHLEGRAPPAAGEPELLVHAADDEADGAATPDPQHDFYELWAMHVDWVDPTQSSLTGPTKVAVPEFTDGCDSACVPQPGSATALDGLGHFTMYRAAYRNFGDHEALVVNHSVDAGGGQLGIRWAELRGLSTTPEAYQTGTFAPTDGVHRWMGSIAMDGSGNIAVGFTAAGPSTFASLRYAARLAGDPLGELSQGEAEIVTGQTAAEEGGYTRWGDYSAMSIDETDDCTFWYAGEYMGAQGGNDWQTHVASFSLPGCQAKGIGRVVGTVTDSAGTPIAGARVHVGTFSALTGADGTYVVNAFPGTYDVKAEKLGYFAQTVSGVVVTEGQDVEEDFQLAAAPLVQVHGFVYDGSHALWPLYAKLTFSATGTTPVIAFTDPETGYYTVTLYGGTDYTASVVSQIPGYDPATRPITPVSGDLLASFGLFANAACTAPGYHRDVTAIAPLEQFENGVPPAGWTVDNTSTNCASGYPAWTDADPSQVGNLTGGAGKFAAADANACGPSATMSTTLTSPPIDLSGFGPDDALRIELDQDLMTYLPGGTDAKIELWDGTQWQTLSEQSQNAQGHLVLASQAANGRSDARIRLTYVSLDWEYWWQIDDLQLSKVSSCQYMIGGLVFGNVTDANTGAAVNGATVTVGNSTVTTAATPDDPNLGDGFWWTWMPAAPAMLTATAPKYGTVSELAIPQVNGARRFDVALPAGMLRFDPASLRIRVPFKQTASATLTVYNDGGAPATIQWSEKQVLSTKRPNGPFAPSTLRVDGDGINDKTPHDFPIHAVPTSARHREAPVSARFPVGVPGAWGIGYDTDTTGAWVGAIGGLGGDRNLHEFRDGVATGNTITMTYDNAFAADAAYDSKRGMLWQVNVGGDNCIHEVDPVAKTVTGNVICPQFGTSERGLAYDPGTDTFYAGSWNDQRVVQFDRAGNVLRSAVLGLNISGLAFNARTGHLFVLNADLATNPQVYVVDATQATLPIVQTLSIAGFGDYEEAGLEMDCDGNFLAVNQAKSEVVVAASGEMTSCLRDLPWMSEAPSPTVVPPHASVDVAVSVDAATLPPGLRFAALDAQSDTPYPTPEIPVAVTVAFNDVCASDPDDPYVHALAGQGIAYGCGDGNFCPKDAILRSYYAVWGLRALLGAMYAPPPAIGLLFDDVAPESYGSDFVEDIYTRGLMDGCGPGKFCPLDDIQRGLGAQIVLRGLEGVNYTPPPATGVFGDVPASDPDAAWIEELARRGIDLGCGGGNFCPNDNLTREEMARWIVTAYGFPVLLP